MVRAICDIWGFRHYGDKEIRELSQTTSIESLSQTLRIGCQNISASGSSAPWILRVPKFIFRSVGAHLCPLVAGAERVIRKIKTTPSEYGLFVLPCHLLWRGFAHILLGL